VWGSGMVVGTVCGGGGVWALVSKTRSGNCAGTYYILHFSGFLQIQQHLESGAFSKPPEAEGRGGSSGRAGVLLGA